MTDHTLFATQKSHIYLFPYFNSPSYEQTFINVYFNFLVGR